MAYGRKLDPNPIPGNLSVADLVDDYFLAYNAARLREACRLFTTKMLGSTSPLVSHCRAPSHQPAWVTPPWCP